MTMRGHLRLLPVLACLWFLLVLPTTVLGEDPKESEVQVPQASPKLAAYLQALRNELGEPANGALPRIDGDARQLLAARSYLRAGASLATRWSWPQEKIDTYPQTQEFATMMVEIGAVQAKFAEANPGYELYVNTQVRSLDLQLQRWNANQSVATSAIALLAASEAQLAAPGFPEAPRKSDLLRFVAFLRAWQPEPPPNLAAPGLSPHGQSLAYDFQIRKGADIIAGAEASQVETVWKGQGWAARLAEAVAAGSKHFRGPLLAPDEPWHYQYTP